MLNTTELTRRRNRVLEAIDKLPVADALAVMSEAIRELAAQEAVARRGAANDGEPSSVGLILRDGVRRFKVERDPEIRDFIHSVRGCTTVDQLVEACQERFGPRSPSRSAIHRYIQRLKFRRIHEEQEG